MKFQSLKNQIVLITGASSGIGFACAVLALKNGAKVVMLSRTISTKRNQFIELGFSMDDFLLLDVDVTEFDKVQIAVNTAIDRFGRVDILISNAGLSMRALFQDTDLHVLHRLMDVNFWGTVHVVKSVLPTMLTRNTGSIIAISSIAGFKGLPARTGYSASKFAMNGFMDTLRIELLNTNIHLGVVSPGFTSSNIRKTALNNEGREQAETPLNEAKLMSAESVAFEIFETALNRKREKVLTFEGRMTFWLRGIIPSLLDRIIFNKLKREANSPLI